MPPIQEHRALSQRFADRVILVTGGSRGIGEAARPIVGDLRDAETCEEIVRETVRAFGRIDGLVNNAGIYPRHRLEEATAETFDLLFHVNTRAPLLSTKAAVAEFQRQGSQGSVVSIGSLNGWSGQPDLTIYSMSKGALMTMTRNLADRFGPERIRFTCLNVGWVATENEKATQISLGMAERWWEKVPAFNAPIGRLQTPQEIAAHICFWLSEDSAPASGQCYEIEQFPLMGRLKSPQA